MEVNFDLRIPERSREEIFRNFRKIYPIDHGSEAFHRRIAGEAISIARCRQMINEIQRFAPLAADTRFLEVGSGYSCLVTLLNKSGVDAYGLEPAFEEYASYRIAREILVENQIDPARVIDAPGENIPFPDCHFSIIYSMSVLEHTQDPEKVIGEVVRVLRPGGTAVLNFPNYGSWWEGHYGLFLLPHSPKWLFKIQAAILGRDTGYVDLLQFITHGDLRRWLKKHEAEVDVVSIGQEIFEERFRTLEFNDWAQIGKLRPLVKLVKWLRITDLVIAVSRKLHWETPFVLVLKKRVR